MDNHQKVAEILVENEDFIDELDIVMALHDESNGITWEMADEAGVSSGAWGRFIQTGILTEQKENEEKYVIDDEEAVEEALEEHVAELNSDGWKFKDKVMGFIGLNLILFYIFPPLRDTVGATMNIAFSPLVSIAPFYIVILLLGLATGIVSTILHFYIKDNEKIGYLKEKVQQYKEEGDGLDVSNDSNNEDEPADNPFDQMDEAQQRMFKIQKIVMLEQTRPLGWILPFTIPVFMWIFWKSNSGLLTASEQIIIFPFIGQAHVAGAVIGPFAAWIFWYFISSLIFTQLFRKLTNIQINPSR